MLDPIDHARASDCDLWSRLQSRDYHIVVKFYIDNSI